MHRAFVQFSIAFTLNLLGAGQFFSAHATDIVLNPDGPIPFGNLAQYSLANKPGTVQTIAWSYQFDSCAGQWFPLGDPNDQAPMIYETFPGQFTVRCQVTYYPLPWAPLPPETLTRSVTVAPPDTIEIIAGNNTSTPVNSYCDTKFRVKSLGVGGYLAGLAQEFISECKIYGNPAAPSSNLNNWVPTSTSDPAYPLFHVEGVFILDKKIWSDTSTLWGQLPNGFELLTCKQAFRLSFTDPCGNISTYQLSPTFDIRIVKDSATTYKITHQ